jgi:hypothetical protein
VLALPLGEPGGYFKQQIAYSTSFLKEGVVQGSKILHGSLKDKNWQTFLLL